MMTLLNNPPIPSQVLVPMYEIASSAHQLSSGLTASQLQTIPFNVPASTFKIGIGVQVADAGTGEVVALKDMARFHFPKVQHLPVNYLSIPKLYCWCAVLGRKLPQRGA